PDAMVDEVELWDAPAEDSTVEEREPDRPNEAPAIEMPPPLPSEPVVQAPELPALLELATPPPPPALPSRPAPRASATPKAAPSRASSTNARSPAGGVNANGPTLFTGASGGQFPAPAYPAFARSSRQQGTVRLLVTVESNGVPSMVSVERSSGFNSLDNAARDQVRRRWRWPSGGLRRYFVPVRFVLQ
ncbi:MAG: energy transducer TonB, partial [Roseimicrobium sp.]